MYRYRTRPSGLKYNITKPNPTSFKPGHLPWTAGTRGAVVAWNKGLKGIRLSPATEFKPGQSGPANPRWTGDAVGYHGLHARVRKQRGRAADHPCAHADSTCSEYMTWANISGRYLGVDDFMPLCMSHHARYDGWGRR